MERINWKEEMGWNEEQIDDLRLAGYAYIRQGKYDIALNFFEALVVLDPASLYDAQTLGALYLELGRLDDATHQLEKTLALEGDHTPTLLNLSKALLMSGRVEEGLKIAEIMKRDKDPKVASSASAILLAFSSPKGKKESPL